MSLSCMAAVQGMCLEQACRQEEHETDIIAYRRHCHRRRVASLLAVWDIHDMYRLYAAADTLHHGDEAYAGVRHTVLELEHIRR